MDEKKTPKSLTETDIVTTERVGRRGALGILGATVVGAAVTAVGLGAPGRAKAATDSDSGPNADAAGRGSSGRSDSDSGPNADRAGHGRGGSGASDSDSGPNADAAGHGSTGRSDSDSGPNADRAGHGHR
ncbi:MAG: hypothetical protein U0230_04690 [Polyangiales bacterium]